MTKSKIVAFVAVAAMFVASSASAFVFNTNLGFGMRNSDVRELQLRLNQEVGTSLPGTTYFGPATRTAARSYQTMKSINPVSGFVGPLTRAALNSSTGTGTGTGTGTSTGTTTQTGPVTVSLATTNPASGVIVAGQATAKLAEFTFTGSGTVNSVMLKRTGISDQNTLTNVYLYDGAARLTDGYSFNNNGDITMNGLGLMVNGSRTISVLADVYSLASSGQTIAVTMTSFTAGTSASTLMLSGNTMSVASGSTLATIGISGSNTVSAASVNAGTTSYTVWRQAVQVNTRALSLKAANFRITGSAPADALQNTALYIDGVKAGTATMIMTNGSNYLSFNMMSAPVNLTTGAHTVEVRGDIVKGSSFNFTVSLQQASDLMVYDPQVGVNVAICGNTSCSTSFSASTAGAISIGSGSFTAVLDPVFSTMSNTTAAASNVTIAKFKIRGYGEDVKVTSLPVTPVLTSATPAASGLQNVTLYFNGSQVGSQQGWTSGPLTYSLGSQMVIPAGVDSTLEVRADLRTTGGTSYTAGNISANLGAATAEGWNSKASITGPTATGNILAMQAGTLGLSKNAGYASQNANPNTAGVKIGSFVLQNQSTSESIRITTLSLSTAYGAGTSSANLSGLRTSETSGNASTPVQPATAAASASGVNTFSTDFTLAPGAVKTIDIFADSSSDAGASATVIPTLTVTSIGMTSNVSATSSATVGNTITFRTGTLGTPSITTSSSTPAQLVAAASGGSADGSLAVYNFVSANASSTITELTFTVTTGTATYVKVGSVSAPVVAGTAYLTGLNIAVPNGGSGANVNAYVTYAEVGTNGIASNTSSVLTLTTIKSTSGNTTTTSTVSVAAPTMTLVGSKPVVAITTTSSPLTGLNIGGVENKIGQITVTADAKGNIKINDISFAVSSTGFATTVPTFTGAKITESGSTTAITGSGCGQGAAAAVSQTIFCEFGTAGNTFTTTTGTTGVEVNTDFDGYTITAGTSKTFDLFATVTGATTTTSTAQISTSLNAAGFNWDDATYAQFVADGSAASPSAGTNLTGSSIYSFPTGSYTIKQ
jgi:hypothetical protein